MKIQLEKVDGKIVKDNNTYILEDNTLLDNMTISRTLLKEGQMTNGHYHDKQEEVYIFTHGDALMQIGDEYHHATTGDMFLIKAGMFHRVFNKSISRTCAFTCIFEKYDRSGNEAKYK